MARTEYTAEQVGDGLLGVMRHDQAGLRSEEASSTLQDFQRRAGFKIDNNLRVESGNGGCIFRSSLSAFALGDESFIGNLEQCNGCGGCRKDAPTMCPTFLATGEEYMSTAAGPTPSAAPEVAASADDQLRREELDTAPSNRPRAKRAPSSAHRTVNLALLKAELNSRAASTRWLRRCANES